LNQIAIAGPVVTLALATAVQPLQMQPLHLLKELVQADIVVAHSLPTAEAGSMSYMLSRETYLNNRDGRWLPHLMLFVPKTDPKSWGAGLPESPILGFNHPEEHLTVFVIPVSKWSDGTLATSKEH
jgi:hypothetical protein